MKPYLYCLMEIGTRELLARCLVSCVAAERGFTVLLGHQYTLLEHATVFPPGVYFSKGTNAISTENMMMAKNNGHLNVACEEENFFRVLQTGPIDCSDDTLPDVCDLFLAMGEEEQSYISQRFDEALGSRRCGNARTDILRPELRSFFDEDVAAVKQEFGRYVLVNSNLGVINAASGADEPETMFQKWNDAKLFKASLSMDQRRAVFQDFITFERGNAIALRGVLAELAKKDINVIFRPHPGERRETWDDFIGGLEVTHIENVSHNSHIPVILGADLVLHTACTTGVEALLLGVPAISVRSTDAEANSYYLSNRFNVSCDSVDKAMALADRHLAGDMAIQSARPELMAGLSHYLDAINTGPLAADRLVDAIENLVAQKGMPNGMAVTARQNDPSILEESRHYTQDSFRKQKLGLQAENVFGAIMKFKKVLGRFCDIRCEQLSESVFKIYR